MTPPFWARSGLPWARSQRARTAAAVLALLSICVPLTVGAKLAFPLWDDGSLWLTIRERGTDAIVASWPARPLNARLWALFASSERAFWLWALAAQAVLWPLLALVSALLWRRLFPAWRSYAGVVACVTVAPFLSKVQMLTANLALGALISVLLGYAALLLLLHFQSSAPRFRGISLAVALAMACFGILLNEYGLAVSIVALVLISFSPFASDRPTRLRSLVASASLAAVSAASYVIYLSFSNYRVTRPDIHPLRSLEVAQGRLLSLPLRLLESLWDGLIGGFAAGLGDMELSGRAGVAAVGWGLVTAALLLLATQGGEGAAPAPPRSRRPMLPYALLLALAAGLAPVVALGRVPWQPGFAMQTRLALPVLPVLAALIVYACLRWFRPAYRAVPLLLLGFAAGSLTFTHVWSEMRERRIMSAVGDALRPHVAAGPEFSIAVVSLPQRPLGERVDWELTARIGAEWPNELRRRFWAYETPGRDRYARELLGTRGACRHPLEIDLRVADFVERAGSVGRVLWVEPERDAPLQQVLSGTIDVVIEPYCAAHAGPGGMP